MAAMPIDTINQYKPIFATRGINMATNSAGTAINEPMAHINGSACLVNERNLYKNKTKSNKKLLKILFN
jgi:hypothetical protein